jgi:cell division protein FtsN
MARPSQRGATRKGRAPTETTPRWAWPVAGLLLGALAGYAVFVLQDHWTKATKREPAPTEVKAKTKPAASPKGTAEPGDRRFDFYTLLPEMEVHVTDDKLKEALKSAPQENDDHGTYILQVGSFRRMEEADGLKARLALLGIEASIQTVIIKNDNVWYRVRVGPYGDLKSASQVGARLRKNDIDFMLLRLGA